MISSTYICSTTIRSRLVSTATRFGTILHPPNLHRVLDSQENMGYFHSSALDVRKPRLVHESQFFKYYLHSD